MGSWATCCHPFSLYPSRFLQEMKAYYYVCSLPGIKRLKGNLKRNVRCSLSFACIPYRIIADISLESKDNTQTNILIRLKIWTLLPGSTHDFPSFRFSSNNFSSMVLFLRNQKRKQGNVIVLQLKENAKMSLGAREALVFFRNLYSPCSRGCNRWFLFPSGCSRCTWLFCVERHFRNLGV